MCPKAFAVFIASRAGLTLVHTPDGFMIDYALRDEETGDIEAWLNVICQDSQPSRDFLLSLAKWNSAIKLIRRIGKPFLLAYRFQNQDFVLQIQKENIPLVLLCENGSDAPFVRIPNKLFQVLAYH